MVKYITFIEFTAEFLRLSLENREECIRKWIKIASTHGLKVLFYGVPMGIKEHAVCIFEAHGEEEKYFKFTREWLGLGTPNAGKFIQNIRTVTVY